MRVHGEAKRLLHARSPGIGDFSDWVNTFPDYDYLDIDYHSDDYLLLPNCSRISKLRLGNLEAFRDWGYAGDYVEAMWLMLQQDKPDDYVVCTGETHTIREFLDVAFNRIGIEDWSNLVVQDPEFYRPAEVDYLRGDSSKTERVLGWKPKHNFEDLVKLMVDSDLR